MTGMSWIPGDDRTIPTRQHRTTTMEVGPVELSPAFTAMLFGMTAEEFFWWSYDQRFALIRRQLHAAFDQLREDLKPPPPPASLIAAGAWYAPSQQLYNFTEVPEGVDLVRLPLITINRDALMWPNLEAWSFDNFPRPEPRWRRRLRRVLFGVEARRHAER